MTDRRQILLQGLDLGRLSGMEIGPLMSPFVAKTDGAVLYVDHADTAALREKYATDPAVDTSRIVEVDAVWGDSTLSECLGGSKVDYVIASHVAEHVPDLVTWLQEIEAVLRPRGELRLVLPDKRFTFDCLRSEARFSDVVHAYLMRARRPSSHALLDCVLDVAANADASALLDGRQTPADIERAFTFDDALRFVRERIACDVYTDVHCWVVTARGFAELMQRLVEVGLTNFACAKFVDSARFEFYVMLRPEPDRQEAARSWQRMADTTVDALSVVAASAPEQLQADDSAASELAWLRGRVAAMEHSTSWRVTAPLRGLVRALRAVSGGRANASG